VPLQFPNKDPGDRLIYGLDFTEAFDTDEAVSANSWAVSPSGLIIEATPFSSKVAQVELSGGTAGTVYTLVATVTTNKGSPPQIWQRNVKIRVKEI